MTPCLGLSGSLVNSFNLRYSTVTVKGALIPTPLSRRGSSRFYFSSSPRWSWENWSLEESPHLASLPSREGEPTAQVIIFQLVKGVEMGITAPWLWTTHLNLSSGPSRGSLSNGHWKNANGDLPPVLLSLSWVESEFSPPITQAHDFTPGPPFLNTLKPLSSWAIPVFLHLWFRGSR